MSLKKLYKTYHSTAGLSVILLILCVAVIYASFSSFDKTASTDKTASIFTVEIKYNTGSQKAEIEGVKTDENGKPTSNALAFDSPYKISILDINGKTIFEEKVSISEQIYFHDETGASQTNLESVSTTVNLPYFKDATKIKLSKGSEISLVDVPMDERDLALPSSDISKISAGGKYKVVVIGDGFSDYGSFTSTYNTFVGSITNVAPYGNVANYIEFVPYNNTTPLGCTGDVVTCTVNRTYQAGLNQAISQTGADAGVILANGSGASATYKRTGPAVININHDIGWAARHEVLGHMIGNLNDRYYNSQYGGSNGVGLAASNCSTDPKGLSWWAAAGATPDGNGNYYQGCETPNTYAPFPNQPSVCTVHQSGNPNTIMADCGGFEFDPVESYYIQHYVLPNLSGGGGGGGTNQPTPTPGGGSGGLRSVVNAVCSDTPYRAQLLWDGSGPGWFVNISEDPNFSGWAQKQVDNVSSTFAPDGFNENLVLKPDVTYYWRVWDTQNESITAILRVPSCSGGGGGINQPTPTTGSTNGCGPNNIPTCQAGPYDIKCIDNAWVCVPEGTGGNTNPTPITNNPTATKAPAKTPTPTKPTSPTATIKPGQPTATKAPNQPTATLTPPNQVTTKISVNVSIPGIGSNMGTGQNPNPTKTSLQSTLGLFNSDGELQDSLTGNINFNSPKFSGEFSLNQSNTQTYEIRIRTNNSLWKSLTLALLTPGQVYQAPDATLTTGDLNQDNVLDLADYNALISCYGSASCSQKESADLNLDGKVDEKDLNIFYSGLANRTGD